MSAAQFCAHFQKFPCIFFMIWLRFQRSPFRAEKIMKIEEYLDKIWWNSLISYINLLRNFMILSAKLSTNLRSRSADFGCALAHPWTFERRSIERRSLKLWKSYLNRQQVLIWYLVFVHLKQPIRSKMKKLIILRSCCRPNFR